MILDFISSKLTLVLLTCFAYISFGHMMYMNNMPVSHQVIMLIILITVQFIGHLLGVSKGIMFATIHKKELNTFLKILDGYDESGEPIDLDEIDKIIEKEFEEK